MGEVRRVSVDVSDESAAILDRMMASGQFADEQDVVRYALLSLGEWPSPDTDNSEVLTDELGSSALRLLWEKGLASGEPVEGNFDPEDIKRRGMTRLSQARAGSTHRG